LDTVYNARIFSNSRKPSLTRILEENKRFVVELETNFAKSKSSMIDDYEKQL
jgi:hypothetical protein